MRNHLWKPNDDILCLYESLCGHVNYFRGVLPRGGKILS